MSHDLSTFQSTHFSPEQSSLHQLISELLEQADIKINGSRPWDIQLLAPGVFERAFSQGNLGLGEAYMDGDWEVQQLDEFFSRLLRERIAQRVKPHKLIFHALRSRLLNRQNAKRAWQVGVVHYDLGNDFYAAMLDPRMTYTCGYWKDADNLAQAQEAKLDLICRKLQLQPGMRVLDIGCGWGPITLAAAEQFEEVGGVADAHRIVSIGMFEHVGHKNYRTYMKVAHRCLVDDGLFLLHTIGKNRRRTTPDPWLDRYIFPNSELPAIGQIDEALEDYFIVEDLHNFGADYDKTLMAWHNNVVNAWPQFSAQLGERFLRMWRYYLLSCAGSFRARNIQVWQWVLSKRGIPGGYRRPE